MTALEVYDAGVYVARRGELLAELEKVVIPKIMMGRMITNASGREVYQSQRGDIIGTVGFSTNFGIGQVRYKGYQEYAMNAKFPDAYRAIIRFADACLPPDFIYNTITLNHNVLAKKHVDTYNYGDSIIIAIGEFEGGGLYVFNEKDEPTLFEIKDRPLMFNGALAAHQTQEFTGNRYTLIFFKQKKEFPRLVIE